MEEFLAKVFEIKSQLSKGNAEPSKIVPILLEYVLKEYYANAALPEEKRKIIQLFYPCGMPITYFLAKSNMGLRGCEPQLIHELYPNGMPTAHLLADSEYNKKNLQRIADYIIDNYDPTSDEVHLLYEKSLLGCPIEIAEQKIQEMYIKKTKEHIIKKENIRKEEKSSELSSFSHGFYDIFDTFNTKPDLNTIEKIIDLKREALKEDLYTGFTNLYLSCCSSNLLLHATNFIRMSKDVKKIMLEDITCGQEQYTNITGEQPKRTAKEQLQFLIDNIRNAADYKMVKEEIKSLFRKGFK